jgi:hypothetical protein
MLNPSLFQEIEVGWDDKVDWPIVPVWRGSRTSINDIVLSLRATASTLKFKGFFLISNKYTILSGFRGPPKPVFTPPAPSDLSQFSKVKIAMQVEVLISQILQVSSAIVIHFDTSPLILLASNELREGMYDERLSKPYT